MDDQRLLLRLTDQFTRFCDNSEPFNLVDANTKPAELWSFARRKIPHLALIAKEVFHVAPTEASCERSFSHQKRIHRPARARLGHENVEHELFVRMNYELL
ncbi:MAG: hypothetical protein AMXMBFR44_6980 [Candidatus Campbellbacteria bacterium]